MTTKNTVKATLLLLLLPLLNACENKATEYQEAPKQEQGQQYQRGNIDTHGSD